MEPCKLYSRDFDKADTVSATRHAGIGFVWKIARWLWAMLLLAGCSMGFPSGGEVPDENFLTVYTALSAEEAAFYLADFAIAQPEIEVELVSLPLETLRQRLLAERDNPQADVLWGVPLTDMLMFEWEDLLRPYAPVGLERVDLRFRDTRIPPNWVGTNVVISALCLNAQFALPAPTSMQSLLEPAYRRNMVMPDPRSSPAGLMFVVDVLARNGEEEGWRYLDELHKNIALYVESDEEVCRLVGRGEYGIGISRYFDNLPDMEYLYFSDQSGWELFTNALVRKSPAKRAAEAFLDWSISEVAMRLYIRRAAITTVQTGFAPPRSFPVDPEAQLRPADLPWAAANLNRILAEWERRYSDKAQQ